MFIKYLEQFVLFTLLLSLSVSNNQTFLPIAHLASNSLIKSDVKEDIYTKKIKSKKSFKEKVEKNELPTQIMFGDKHGVSDDLDLILRRVREVVKSGEELHVIGHGNFFGWGNENYENWDILRFLKGFSETYENIDVTFLLGNHELLMISSILLGNKRDFYTWISKKNGGQKTINEFKEKGIDITEVALWILTHSKFFHISEWNYLHIHAGIVFNGDKPAYTLEQLINWQYELDQIQLELIQNAKLIKHEDMIKKITQLFRKINKFLWIRENGWINNLAEPTDKATLFPLLKKISGDYYHLIEPNWNVLAETYIDKTTQLTLLTKLDTKKADTFLAEYIINGVVFGHLNLDHLMNLDNRLFCIDMNNGKSGYLVFNDQGMEFYSYQATEPTKIITKEEILTNIDDQIKRLEEIDKIKEKKEFDYNSAKELRELYLYYRLLSKNKVMFSGHMDTLYDFINNDGWDHQKLITALIYFTRFNHEQVKNNQQLDDLFSKATILKNKIQTLILDNTVPYPYIDKHVLITWGKSFKKIIEMYQSDKTPFIVPSHRAYTDGGLPEGASIIKYFNQSLAFEKDIGFQISGVKKILHHAYYPGVLYLSISTGIKDEIEKLARIDLIKNEFEIINFQNDRKDFKAYPLIKGETLITSKGKSDIPPPIDSVRISILNKTGKIHNFSGVETAAPELKHIYPFFDGSFLVPAYYDGKFPWININSSGVSYLFYFTPNKVYHLNNENLRKIILLEDNKGYALFYSKDNVSPTFNYKKELDRLFPILPSQKEQDQFFVKEGKKGLVALFIQKHEKVREVIPNDLSRFEIKFSGSNLEIVYNVLSSSTKKEKQESTNSLLSVIISETLPNEISLEQYTSKHDNLFSIAL